MLKRDLKSAFRHVPISPHDYWLLIFEWDGSFYIDMFLPFGLRTAPRIFNMFSEALHWIFETLFQWDLTHYLDDFLFVFAPGTDLSEITSQYNKILATVGFTGATEKDMQGCVVSHLGFELDSTEMQVRLPANKRQRAVQIVQSLLKMKSAHYTTLEQALGFLSHCCQVVPLGRPFLRNIFSLLRGKRRHIRLSRAAIKDLQWWQIFLSSWSTITVIQPSHLNHDAATDVSGLKGIGGVYKGQLFSERIPSRHREKHINFKEMFAILHAFVLWHEQWATGRVRLACDNSAVVDGIKKRSIDGPAITPLQTILLIAALFDIDLTVFWVPSEENIVADAASRHDFKKLANLGFQDQIDTLRHGPHTIFSTRMSTLRRKLHSCFITRSPQQLDGITSLFDNPTKPIVRTMDTPRRSRHRSNPSHIGSLKCYRKSNHQQQKGISMHSAPFMSSTTNPSPSLMTPALTLSSEEANESTGRENVVLASPSLQTSSSASSEKPGVTSMAPISRRHSVWHLPDSFELENLHGKTGTTCLHRNTISPESMSRSIKTALPHSYSLRPRQTPSGKGYQSTYPLPLHHYAQCEPFKHCSTLTQNELTNPSLPGQWDPSAETMSSTISKISCSPPVSAQRGSLAIPSGKEPPSQQPQRASQKRKSNSLADGEAMLLMSTSMNLRKRIKSKNSST
jgi:hypothetical protein